MSEMYPLGSEADALISETEPDPTESSEALHQGYPDVDAWHRQSDPSFYEGEDSQGASL